MSYDEERLTPEFLAEVRRHARTFAGISSSSAIKILDEVERLRGVLYQIATDKDCSEFQSNPRKNPMMIARTALGLDATRTGDGKGK